MSKFYCNFFDTRMASPAGIQPVRTMYYWCENVFLNIQKQLSDAYNVDLSQLGFAYDDDPVAVKSPRAATFFIQIHESFLSFLWAYIYGYVISMPLGGKEVNEEDQKKADLLFMYAVTLLDSYSEWDKESLPNPEWIYQEHYEFVGKINALFVVAVNFIIYHEFAHVVLSHSAEEMSIRQSGAEIDRARSLEMEFDADKFAFKNMRSSGQFEDHDFAGVLCALCSLTVASPNFSGGRDHPDPDHRLKRFLDSMCIPNDHVFWSMSSWALLKWRTVFPMQFELPEAFIDSKSFFEEILRHIDNAKVSAIQKK